MFNFSSIVTVHRFGGMALMPQSQSLVNCAINPSASCGFVSSINGGLFSGVNFKTSATKSLGLRLRTAALFEGEGKIGGRLTSIPTLQTVSEAIKEQCLIVLDNPETREKFKKLRTLIVNSGEDDEDIHPMVKFLYFNEKKLVQLKLASRLLSLRLMDPAVVKSKAKVLAKKMYTSEFEKAMDELSRHINDRIEYAISKSPELKRDLELWRQELKNAYASPSFESRLWLEARARQISEALSARLESPEFNEEYDRESYEKWKAERDQYYS